jgi:hypothetical protein
MDAGSEFPGAAILVSAGTTLANTAWTCTNSVAPTVGSTAVTFAQFSGGTTTLAGDVTGPGSANTVAKIGGTVISSTGAGGTVTLTGKFAQSGATSAATDLATKAYVDAATPVVNYHDLEGLPQRFTPEPHAWNDSIVHAGPTLSTTVALNAGASVSPARSIPDGQASPGLEYSASGRFRAPADLSAARWMRLWVHASGTLAGSYGIVRATTDAGANWTTLAGTDGNPVALLMPTVDDTDGDTGYTLLHPSVQQLGVCTLALFVYGNTTGSAQTTLVLNGIFVQIGVLE